MGCFILTTISVSYTHLVAELAKRATLRPVGSRNLDRRYADLEQELLAEINETGIGPAGLGGDVYKRQHYVPFRHKPCQDCSEKGPSVHYPKKIGTCLEL